MERYIAVCHPFQKEKFCTGSRAIKVVCGLVSLSVLLSCIQAYLWSYDQEKGRCGVRPEVQEGGNNSLWSIWNWCSEILTFFVVPALILLFNVFVLREVKKLSELGVSMLAGMGGAGTQGGSAATTVMLLSVSFYVIFTTIPASIVYTLNIPEGHGNMTDYQVKQDPTWQTYFDFIIVRKVVEEVCLSHYACNIILYIITGTEFRQSLADMFKSCRKGSKYAEVNHTHNGYTHQTHV